MWGRGTDATILTVAIVVGAKIDHLGINVCVYVNFTLPLRFIHTLINETSKMNFRSIFYKCALTCASERRQQGTANYANTETFMSIRQYTVQSN